MIIKKAKYKKVRKLVRELVSQDVYGCDNCKNQIYGDNGRSLQITVFNHGEDAESISPSNNKEFCSWKCVFEYLPKIKCNYFISLPFLHFDETKVGLRATDFMEITKK